MSRFAFYLTLLLCAGAVASAAPIILIDDFNDPAGTIGLGVAVDWAPYLNSQWPVSVLGGERDIEIRSVGATGSTLYSINTPIGGVPGAVQVGGLGAAPSLRLVYDGIDGLVTGINPAAGLDQNVNLPNAQFAFLFGYTDLPGAHVILNLYTNLGGGVFGVSTSRMDLPVSATPYTVLMPLSGFAQSTGSAAPATLTDVDAFEVLITGGVVNLDLAFDHFELTDVPEPGTLMLMGVAIVGLGFACGRRRRRA